MPFPCRTPFGDPGEINTPAFPPLRELDLIRSDNCSDLDRPRSDECQTVDFQFYVNNDGDLLATVFPDWEAAGCQAQGVGHTVEFTILESPPSGDFERDGTFGRNLVVNFLELGIIANRDLIELIDPRDIEGRRLPFAEGVHEILGVAIDHLQIEGLVGTRGYSTFRIYRPGLRGRRLSIPAAPSVDVNGDLEYVYCYTTRDGEFGRITPIIYDKKMDDNSIVEIGDLGLRARYAYDSVTVIHNAETGCIPLSPLRPPEDIQALIRKHLCSFRAKGLDHDMCQACRLQSMCDCAGFGIGLQSRIPEGDDAIAMSPIKRRPDVYGDDITYRTMHTTRLFQDRSLQPLPFTDHRCLDVEGNAPIRECCETIKHQGRGFAGGYGIQCKKKPEFPQETNWVHLIPDKFSGRTMFAHSEYTGLGTLSCVHFWNSKCFGRQRGEFDIPPLYSWNASQISIDQLATPLHALYTTMLQAISINNMGRHADFDEQFSGDPGEENAWHRSNGSWKMEKIFDCTEWGQDGGPPEIVLPSGFDIECELVGMECPVTAKIGITEAHLTIYVGIFNDITLNTTGHLQIGIDVSVDVTARLFKRVSGECITPTRKNVRYRANSLCHDTLELFDKDNEYGEFIGERTQCVLVDKSTLGKTKRTILPDIINAHWQGKIGPQDELSRVDWTEITRIETSTEAGLCIEDVAPFLRRELVVPGALDALDPQKGKINRYMGSMGIQGIGN